MIYLCSLTILLFIAYCASVLRDVSAIEPSINNPFGFVFSPKYTCQIKPWALFIGLYLSNDLVLKLKAQS